MKNNSKLVFKIIFYIMTLILSFNIAVLAIDNIIPQNTTISSKINASNQLRMANTTTSDNFFYDVSSIYYQSHPDSTYLVDQFANSNFIFSGIKLPETPTITIAPTIDTDLQFGLVFKFASIKVPILGFQILLWDQFDMVGSTIFTNTYSTPMNFYRTDSVINGYRVWNIAPTTATGDSLYFVFRTGFTANTISRPFDLIQYQMFGNPTEAYNNGYNLGLSEGQQLGYQNGYNAGYDKAMAEGITSPEHLFYSVWAILKTFGDMLLSFFNINVFGNVSLGMIFVVLPFTFALIGKIVEIIIKLISLGGSK